MSVHKQENGKWAVSFYYDEWNGERSRHRKTGFRTKKEAQEYERDYLANKSGTPKMTFATLCDLYLESLSGKVKYSTYHVKQETVAMLNTYFGSMPLDTIKPAAVLKWQTEMMKKNYSPSTLREYHRRLSAIFNFACKYYGLPDNPARQCGAMGRRENGNISIWTVDQVQRVEDNMKNDTLRIMLDLLFWSGIRVGEMLALECGDICGDVLRVSKTQSIVNGKRTITPPKTAKSVRDIPLPAGVSQMINDYISRIPYAEKDTPLFPVCRTAFRDAVDRAAKAAGVPRIRLHDIRHSHASLLIEMGCSPVLIAERLGHENVQTTLQIYSHLYPNKHGLVAYHLDNLRTGGQNLDNSSSDDQKN